MDWLNPVEWFAWIYGKFFQEHVFVGGAAMTILFAALGIVLWVRGVDKFKEEHPSRSGAASDPKQQTVTVSNGASQNVAVESKTDGMQSEPEKLIPQKRRISKGGTKSATPEPPSQGIVGVAGDDALVEMSGSSQIVGYRTGVQGDHAHVVMKDQSRIDSNPNPDPLPPSAPAYQRYSGNPSGPVFSNIGIKSPPTDLPLNTVPMTPSTSSAKDQTGIIQALVKEWRDSHPNWTVIGRNAIKWMNQRLEEQGKDFRIQMPEHCNPPYPGFVGFSVPSGAKQTLENVKIDGAMLGVEAGQNSTVQMNNTQIVVEDKCD